MRGIIYEADTAIGEAKIIALDPPMGVAIAEFTPSGAYNMEHHANVINGDYVGDRSDRLRIELANGIPLISQAISIQDWPQLGEREAHILGILEPSFESLFSEHPDFVAYWGKT